MKQRIAKVVRLSLILISLSFIGGQRASAAPLADFPFPIGTQVQMFVDDRFIEPNMRRGISLELQTPVRREVVLTTDKPWEGHESAYFTIIQDGNRFRLYYRGSAAKSDLSAQQFTCLAE